MEIDDEKRISVQKINIILRDGVPIGEILGERKVIAPGDIIDASEPDEVKEVINVLHTPTRINNFQQKFR